MQKTRGAALLAATALVMSGLAACGDEGEPGEATSTASPSAEDPSSSETSSSSGETSSGSQDSSSSAGGGGDEVAELPDPATKKTKAGAIAFNEFYQDQLGEALKTGNIASLEKYTDACDVCDNFIEKTEANKAKGVTMDQNPYSTHDASASNRSDGGFKVTLTVDSKGYREVLSDGSKGRQAKKTSYKVATDTQWHEGHWVIRDSVIIE